MPMSRSDDVDVVIVGGGAAGIAAARRLCDASVRCLVVEARPRLGGRAWTVHESGFALDLGCGWLHSADRNRWREIAEAQGASIDKTPPPWVRPTLEIGFSRADLQDYRAALAAFFARVNGAANSPSDLPAAALLDPGCRWNALINAIGSYMSGVELDRLSAQDLGNYRDSGVNWRVIEGLGSVVSTYGAELPAVLECPASLIDHRGTRLRIETAKGGIAADQVIVTVPTAVLAAEQLKFTPALPQKTEAARALPLGLNDKLFISLDSAEEFPKDSRLFAQTNTTATAAYHCRPFGRPQIECYFGGRLASELEAHGEAAFFDYAVSELTNVLGSAFARRLKPVRVYRWGSDPFSLGSYSYALPGFADRRETLAAPFDDRLFFAGEACSVKDYSTAHGAWNTGAAAADQVLAVRRKSSMAQLAEAPIS